MKLTLPKVILIIICCIAAVQPVKAAANFNPAKRNANIPVRHKYHRQKNFKSVLSVRYNDTLKMIRTVNSMPVQTTDTGNYGLHLQITRNADAYAQTGIYFYANAADKYIETEDAAVVNGGNPQVYISTYTSDNVQVCINTLSDYAKGKRIRIFVSAIGAGTYTLSLADILGIDTAAYSIRLVDNLLRDSVDLLHIKAYPFNITFDDTGSFGANRFVLAIAHKPVGQYELSYFAGQKVSAGVQINWQATNAGNYTGYNLQKQNPDGNFDSLYAVQSDTGNTKYQFVDTHPAIGNNVYRLRQNGITGDITFSNNITIGYNSSTPNGAINVYPNPAKNTVTVTMASTSIGAQTYIADIYDLSGTHVKHQLVNGASWVSDVSAYKNGLYIIQIKDSAGNLIGQSKFIKMNQ